MQNNGKRFEQNWKDSYKDSSYYYMRLADSNKFNFGKGTRFTPSNPCDVIQYSMPFLWLLELKSTKGTSVSIAQHKKDKNKMIRYSQIEELHKASKYQGIIAGFVINFRPRKTKTTQRNNITYFINIIDFIEFRKANLDKKSINEHDCKKYGIPIQSELKRVNYVYDIDSFVNDSVVHYVKNYMSKKYFDDINNWLGVIKKAI